MKRLTGVAFSKKLLLLAVMLGAPMSCTVHSVYEVSPQPDYWRFYEQQADKIESWSIDARVGLKFEDDGGFADLDWRQNSSGFHIGIQGSLGSGTLGISSDGSWVTLVDRDGNIHQAEDVDQLVLNVTGWRIPVAGMAYWLRGLPVTGYEYEFISWDEQGHLVKMVQDGWEIEMARFRHTGEYELPHRVTMKRIDNDNISIKLVIRHWQAI